jgi:hypothetical protein
VAVYFKEPFQDEIQIPEYPNVSNAQEVIVVLVLQDFFAALQLMN